MTANDVFNIRVVQSRYSLKGRKDVPLRLSVDAVLVELDFENVGNAEAGDSVIDVLVRSPLIKHIMSVNYNKAT